MNNATQTKEQQAYQGNAGFTAQPEPPVNPILVIQKHFLKEDVMKKIAKHCETDVDGVERIVRDLTNAVRSSQDDRLAFCTPQSFVNCIYDAHALKLRIDARQHCYLVRYGDQAKIAPSYKGYVNRLKESLEGFDIQNFIWFSEGEFIDSSKDGVASYEYRPSAKNRTRSDYINALGCAVYITYSVNGDKRSVIEVIGQNELKLIKSKSKQKSGGVWNEWFGEQAKKATVRRACKLRFALITDDLDALDNEHFDLEGEPQESAAERMAKKMNSQKYNPFPGDGPIIDAEVKEEGGADPAKNEPENPAEAQNPEENRLAPIEGDSEVVEGVQLFDGVPEWQGGLIIDGAEVARQFQNINAAYAYLVKVATKRATRTERLKVLDENVNLMATLFRHHRQVYESVIEMVNNGAPDDNGQNQQA